MSKLKRFTALITVLILILTAVVLPPKNVTASSGKNMEILKKEILDKAVTYLKEDINEDGSYGDVRFINDTSDAALALRSHAEEESATAVKWIKNQKYNCNTDMLARTAIAANDLSVLDYVFKVQNKDGGFGLSKEYRSDIFDSILVLDALNMCNASGEKMAVDYSEQAFRLVCYIARNMNTDGSYSYNKHSEADLMLTSMALYTVNKYMTDNKITSDLTTSMMNKTSKYLAHQKKTKLTEKNVEDSLYVYLALCQNGNIDNPEQLLNELNRIQNTDGSIYGSSHYTALMIRLLDTLDLNSMVKLHDFVITNTDTAYYGVESSINLRYAVSYDATADMEYDIYVEVTNGKTTIYESKRQTVVFKQGENILEGTINEFTINENKDDGIVVTLRLCNGNDVIRECRGGISLINQPRAGETEITDFTLELNNYYTYVGSPIELEAEYKLLYNTNVGDSVDMRVTVTKGNKTISEKTYHEELVLSENEAARKCASFTPDITKAGTYKIKAECLYDGEIVCEQETAFVVLELPDKDSGLEDATPSDAAFDDSITVSWIGPYLTDYVLYAGKETEIEASAGLIYYAKQDFAGRLVVEVKRDNLDDVDDTVIEEKELQIALSADSINYKSDKLLTFKVKESGVYRVAVTLFNEDGEEIKTGYREVKVTDKKTIPLIAVGSISKDEEKTVDISWNDISDSKERYNYRLYRRYDGTDWEARSIWNESDRVKVLNAYPAGAYLEKWMTTTISNSEEPAGMGLFDITSVYMREFNYNPEKYLYDENGNWAYDVIFFGSADSNCGFDLSNNAYYHVQKFVDSGRGVLFGHDTISGEAGIRNNFNKFAPQLGMKLYNWGGWNRTTSVSVNTIGTLTNFPWSIRGTLTIPATHSTAQFIGYNTDTIEWITLNAYVKSDDEGYHDNFYLATRNNLGFIQTGDSYGAASDDERKVLANTLFYLHQISQVTTAKDNSFYDITAPDIPSVEFTGGKADTATFNIKANDNGTRYEYRIEAIPVSDSESIQSNVMTHTALSGIKGYVYEINNSPNADSSLLEYDENNEIVQNVNPADSTGNFRGEITIPDFEHKWYMHVWSVDNQNNVSEELVIPLDEGVINTAISTDKKQYTIDEAVLIDSETTAIPYGSSGDVSIALYDGEGNYVEELAYQNAQTISADTAYELNGEWDIDDEAIGSYSVRITWTRGGTQLAQDETDFKIMAREDETEASEENSSANDTAGDDDSSSTSENDVSTRDVSSEEGENDTKESDTTENTTQPEKENTETDESLPDTGDKADVNAAFAIILICVAGILILKKIGEDKIR